MLCFYRLSIDAVVLQIQDMLEFGNCQKCQKCTDFTQIHLFLALLRMRLRAVLNSYDFSQYSSRILYD